MRKLLFFSRLICTHVEIRNSKTSFTAQCLWLLLIVLNDSQHISQIVTYKPTMPVFLLQAYTSLSRYRQMPCNNNHEYVSNDRMLKKLNLTF